MTRNNRRWERQAFEVPCKVSYANGIATETPASIVNLSPGGVMLASEQAFIANERVSIELEDGFDALLFEFADTLTGTVRWSQATRSGGRDAYHVGVAFERELPHKIILTEQ
jgi:hypothetical protein